MPPLGSTVRLRGYREFKRAARNAGPDARREFREAFADVGEGVRAESERRFARYDPRSASGYRVGVRASYVIVYQSFRKTTGQRPDYGALQMRKALLAAAASEESDINERLETAVDRIADHFEE